MNGSVVCEEMLETDRTVRLDRAIRTVAVRLERERLVVTFGMGPVEGRGLERSSHGLDERANIGRVEYLA